MASSEGNNAEFQQSQPSLCTNGCGFFGTAATLGLCSKCYRDSRIEEERTTSAKAAFEKLIQPEQKKLKSDGSDASIGSSSSGEDVSKASDQAEKKPAAKNRCANCNKKVGVLGFQCRCGETFCGVHRYAEKHGCTFDFKSQGRDSIAKANPVVRAEKIEDRI